MKNDDNEKILTEKRVYGFSVHEKVERSHMISQNLDASEDKRLSFNSSPILVTQPTESDDVSGLIRLASLLHGLRRTWLRALPIAILFCVGGAALGWFLRFPSTWHLRFFG